MDDIYLKIPNTGWRLSDGDIVKLINDSSPKWVLHYGWYNYEDTQYSGWYLVSILGSSVLPMTESILTTLSVVTTNTTQYACPPPKVTEVVHVPYEPVVYTEQDKELLLRAMTTVETIEDRDGLENDILPDGKIVRVNSEGQYYQWRKHDTTWIIANFGDMLSKREADTFYVPLSEFQTVDERLEAVEEATTWGTL